MVCLGRRWREEAYIPVGPGLTSGIGPCTAEIKRTHYLSAAETTNSVGWEVKWQKAVVDLLFRPII